MSWPNKTPWSEVDSRQHLGKIGRLAGLKRQLQLVKAEALRQRQEEFMTYDWPEFADKARALGLKFSCTITKE